MPEITAGFTMFQLSLPVRKPLESMVCPARMSRENREPENMPGEAAEISLSFRLRKSRAVPTYQPEDPNFQCMVQHKSQSFCAILPLLTQTTSQETPVKATASFKWLLVHPPRD